MVISQPLTLRGAGADKTLLIFTGAVGCLVGGADVCITNGNGVYPLNPGRTANWTAGYAKGTSKVTLSSTAGLSVGDMMVLTGKTVLTLDLVSVRVNGRMVDINTQTFSQASGSRGARTAKMAGGGAALGAIIGGIAGGGKGAAIGAIVGGGVGVGSVYVEGGKDLMLEPGTEMLIRTAAPARSRDQ